MIRMLGAPCQLAWHRAAETTLDGGHGVIWALPALRPTATPSILEGKATDMMPLKPAPTEPPRKLELAPAVDASAGRPGVVPTSEEPDRAPRLELALVSATFWLAIHDPAMGAMIRMEPGVMVTEL